MPLVEEETLATLRAAAEAPATYVSGTERQELRAAFDLACSQITNGTLKFQSQNRMMLRAKLNSLKPEQIPPEYGDVISALKKALKRAEPLYSSKAYLDDDEEDVAQMRKFASQGLKPLLEAIAKFP